MNKQSQAVLIGGIALGIIAAPIVIVIASHGFKLLYLMPVLLAIAVVAGTTARRLWKEGAEAEAGLSERSGGEDI